MDLERTMDVLRWIDPVLSVVRERRRRWSLTPGFAHLELRALVAAEHAALARRVEEAFAPIAGVAWAEVNPFTNRLDVAYDPAACEVDALIAVLEGLEVACGFADRPFRSEDPEHPGDVEPIVRACVEIAADLLGASVALAGRVLAPRVGPLQVDLVALFSVLEGVPRLRRLVEERLGRQSASLLLGAANAFAHGVGQTPVGPLVDALQRAVQVGERIARRRAWWERAPELHGARARHAYDEPVPRPVPLPNGVIEEYAEAAFAGSIGAFGLGVVATGSLADALAGLLGGLPRPARLGRETFAALLGRALARRGVVVLDPGVLRRLDRIDTVLVAAELAGTAEGRALVASARAAGLRVVAAGAADAAAAGVDEVVAGALDATLVGGLQRAGRVVMVIADRPTPALRAADCGIGLARRGAAAPWMAHLVTGPSLADARQIVAACAAARTMAQQSVWLAEAGVAGGVLLALGGLHWNTTLEIMTAVNTATLVAMANGARLAWALPVPPEVVPEREPVPWHRLSVAETLRRLGTSVDGLGSAAATRRHAPPPPAPGRLARFGTAFAEQLDTPLTPFLAAGAGLSALAGSVVDAVMVGGVAVVNGLIGAAQRVGTETAIAGLTVEQQHVTRVRRDGRVRKVDASALVPGDVVLLQAGDLVRADCRIIEAVDLEVDESSLTGESLPVAKRAEPCDAVAVADRTSVLYAGTAVVAGRATAVVFAVGDATEARRAAAGAAPPRSGVEARLESLVDLTAPAAAVSGLVLAGAGLVRGAPWRDVLSAGVSLAVAAVPEGLPLLATTAQLAAARRLSRRGTLVRNARAVEALGRVDVVCLDKTGTLTEGRIQLRVVSDGVSEAPVDARADALRGVLTTAVRATPVAADERQVPHLTDRALLEGAARVSLARGAGWRPLAELPFEPGRGYHAVLGREGGAYRLCVKGAPEVVLARCTQVAATGAPLDAAGRLALERHAQALATRGLRVLAVAERVLPSNGGLDDARVAELVLRGFVGFSDPVRTTAQQAIDGLRRAGVRTVMMTGDHPSTAATIAAELGLGGRAPLTGGELAALDDAALAALVRDTSVYARLTPTDKVRLVRALQQAGHTVAMAGDGANDAPAIRMAHVGIALNRGGTGAASVARGAADLVVTDDRIESLVDAILEGRAMWAAVRDAVAVLVGGNLGEIGFTLGAGLLSGCSPLNARQLLLVNLLTDAFPAMAIAIRPPRHRTPESLLHEGPEASLGAVLERDIAARALVTAAGTGAAWLFARATGSAARAGTVALVSLVGAQLGQTLVAGGASPLVVATSVGSLVALGVCVQTPGLSHLFGCRPLGPVAWATALGTSAAATAASVALPRFVDLAVPGVEPLQRLVARAAERSRALLPRLGTTTAPVVSPGAPATGLG